MATTHKNNFLKRGENLKMIYDTRFGADTLFRKKMYRILCQNFFQQFIPKNAVICEIAAGYCEFINEIQARKKYALDLNPDVRIFANSDIECVIGLSTEATTIPPSSVDVVYCSNFFEHISWDDISKTFDQVWQMLVPGGKMLILQPNFRYCYKDFYMFLDHITPIDDRALLEMVNLKNFKIIKWMPKFLPFTTKSKIPKWAWLIKLYIKLPFAFCLFGKQAFIVIQKPF